MELGKLLDATAEQGWYAWDDFLTPDQVSDLRSCAPESWQQARIGRQDEAQRISQIRSDKIQWRRTRTL